MKFEDLAILKRLGQNFLIDDNIANNIVSSANILTKDIIVEVGPGRGKLTELIKKQCQHLIVYEIDKKLSNILFQQYKNSNVEVIHNDFLKVDLINTLQKKYGKNNLIMIANLPYYITSKIIIKALQSQCFKKLIIMVQKEFAERLVAKFGFKNYSSFTVITDYYSNKEILFNVPHTAFFPQPKVESVIVEICCKDINNDNFDINNFLKFIKLAFSQKRKILVNNLKIKYNKNEILKVLNELNLNQLIRPEDIKLDIFIEIFNILNKNNESKNI